MERQVSRPIKSARVKGPIGTFVPNFIVLSISSLVPIPSYRAKIDSLIYGINSLFAINPGISLEVEVYFFIFAANLT